MGEPTRRDIVDQLYTLLEPLASLPGQGEPLGTLTAEHVTTSHGVYLFHEPGELREDGRQPRIVRVGTHALTATSSATLWSRLRTHRGSVRGPNAGGGSHRSSVFRLHVGTALVALGLHPDAAQTWAVGSSAPADTRSVERPLELAVSERIGAMPVFWLDVPDREERGQIERGCIALLSNHSRSPIDPPSPDWLGQHADRAAVRTSGLWNVNHVEEAPSADVLELVAAAVERTGGGPAARTTRPMGLADVARTAETRYLDRVRRDLHALDNTTRASFAEELVAAALDGATSNANWAGHDIDWNGVRIEVKASGAHQSWHRASDAPSRPSWSVPPRRAWDPAENAMADDAARTADVYVLCRHEGTAIDAGWTFYVVPTSVLDALGQSSLSASTLSSNGITAVEIDELPRAVRDAAMSR